MMIRVTLRQLSYFAAVADAGSLAGAAKALHVSQPSISAALAVLEDTLEVDLFLRHHAQGVSLTPTGRQLLTTARAILAGAEDFEFAGRKPPHGSQRVYCALAATRPWRRCSCPRSSGAWRTAIRR